MKTSNTTKGKHAQKTNAAVMQNASAPAENHDPFFAEPIDPIREGREQGIEVIRQLLIWMAEAPTLEKRGLCATVALHCIRPDLIHGITLEKIGQQAGCSRQCIHKLVHGFRDAMGLEQ